MKELKTLNRFAIFPPTDLKDEDLFDFSESIAETKDKAWEKFLWPSLCRKAYEDDGFEALPIVVKFYAD